MIQTHKIDPWEIIRLVGDRELDFLDCRLIDALAHDLYGTQRAIARHSRMSEAQMRYRIKRLARKLKAGV
jgi:DNA-binding Lrp family transcriptional regulator